MAIKARKLKRAEIPGKTELYEFQDSRNIAVEEKQEDGSLDQVTLEYSMGTDDVGYFAKEYRPADVQKTGSKVIDITAAMLNGSEKWIRWHLYDIKDTLAGENTAVKLYNQWNSGLQYLQKNILSALSEYSITPDLGVITRSYDNGRMERLRNDYQKICDEIENNQQNLTLPQRKKRTEIGKYRAVLKASQAILDRKFQAESKSGTYEIRIRKLFHENDQIYKLKFPV